MIPLQQQIQQKAFAEDDESDTDTEQRLGQKNTGGGESTNFNCGSNAFKGVPSSLSFCETEETPPTPGTLLIEKFCAPEIGGECPGGGAFSVEVTGNNAQPTNFLLGHGDSQLVTLDPGPFSILEGVPGPDFVPQFSGDCEQTAPGSEEATGTINAGQQLTCTILNLHVVPLP